MKEVESTLGKAFTQFFVKYGEKQVHLWLLATHPDYRRRGAATMLCQWGFEKVKEKSWIVPLFASPLGKLLYEHLGYELLASTVPG